MSVCFIFPNGKSIVLVLIRKGPDVFILFNSQQILVFYLAKNLFLTYITLLLTCKDTLCYSTIALSLITTKAAQNSQKWRILRIFSFYPSYISNGRMKFSWKINIGCNDHKLHWHQTTKVPQVIHIQMIYIGHIIKNTVFLKSCMIDFEVYF